jgi:hypothetical protein
LVCFAVRRLAKFPLEAASNLFSDSFSSTFVDKSKKRKGWEGERYSGPVVVRSPSGFVRRG